jgi:hypothetical protein
METPSKKSVIIVFTFFLLMLFAWFTFSVIGVTKAIITKSWPKIKGSIISTEVKEVKSFKGATKFAPVVHYSYTFNNEEFISDKYSSTLARGSSIWADEVISHYPDNSAISIYYNPQNPKESVLDPGLHADNYWRVILSSFFIFVVLLAFIKQLKT